MQRHINQTYTCLSLPTHGLCNTYGQDMSVHMVFFTAKRGKNDIRVILCNLRMPKGRVSTCSSPIYLQSRVLSVYKTPTRREGGKGVVCNNLTVCFLCALQIGAEIGLSVWQHPTRVVGARNYTDYQSTAAL